MFVYSEIMIQREQSRQSEAPVSVTDVFGRPLRSLRLSLTDRCNLRCRYCMPEREYVWLERKEMLSFEEIAKLTEVFTKLGVEKVRLTGGEPLLRRDLDMLVRMVAANPRVNDLALTTNGLLLADYAKPLKEAGLRRVTVSLDTLRRDRFQELARQDGLGRALAGIAAARAAGFDGIKINTVIMRGLNDDEIVDLLEFGREAGAEVRFIEYMDVGGATKWSMDNVVTCAEIIEKLTRHYGPIRAMDAPPKESAEMCTGRSLRGAAPADRFLLPDGTAFGIISSTTRPFCGSCDRARLTPDGLWLTCLYARDGIDLKTPLRSGVPLERIAGIVREAWCGRSDRGAEQRLHVRSRDILYGIDELRQYPHREMHTRGG